MRDRIDRRRLLVVAAGLLAGCARQRPADATARTTTGGGTPATGTADERTPVAGDDLDLREANVVGVAVEDEAEGYRFDVTLHHDDAGEPGYANWWQVETLDGDRLGRRELLHPHDRQPFTRSTTVEVPAGVACVVVRGHDETHGYGGVARIVNLETGETAVVRQGPERRAVDPPAGFC